MSKQNPITLTAVADKIQVLAQQEISRREAKRVAIHGDVTSSIFRNVAGNLVVMLETYVAGMADEKIIVFRRWPRDWWEALKERWFPGWLLGKFPVVYDSIDIEEKRHKAVCPHLACDDKRIHMKWLYENSREKE